MLEVAWSNKSRKFLKSADTVLVKRILQKIKELQGKPVSTDTKVIQGYQEKLYRARVDDYRILYEIDFSTKTIGIVKIDKRSRVYD